MKKALKKDIKKSFTKSTGRFISIMCLIALGSFALVGLQVAGPDMRKTGETYFETLQVADIAIIGDYGIDAENQNTIEKVSGAQYIEYGYLKDVVIKDTITSFRIFSQTENLSLYEVVSGRLPEKPDEIALASSYEGEYNLGDDISFEEKEDISGNKVLNTDTFEIVGFVNSGELVCTKNLGNSNAGTGELQGYAVVCPEAFDSEVYMIARLSFSDTKGLDPYSELYAERIQAHKEELNQLMKDEPGKRLLSIKAEFQKEIDEGQEALDDAKKQFQEAQTALDDANARLNKGYRQLNAAKAEVAAKKQELEEAEEQILAAEAELQIKKAELAQKQQEYDSAYAEYSEKKQQFEKVEAVVGALQRGIDSSRTALETKKQNDSEDILQLEQEIADLQNKYSDETLTLEEKILLEQQIAKKEAELSLKKAEQKNFLEKVYPQGIALADKSQKALDTYKKENLEPARQQLIEAEKELNTAQQQLSEGQQQISDAEMQLTSAKHEVQVGKEQLSAANRQIDASENERRAKYREYQQALNAFETQRPEAEKKIADAEAELAEARAELNALTQPAYALDTRREIPGAEGYRVYATIAEIIDELAKVFPIFMYFVAALVTLTTMTRFVDEERLNSGTLRALGYDSRDVIKKFVVYGFASSTIGALIGIAAGHTLLPMIVYGAYGKSFTLPRIELHFYLSNSVVALCLTWLSAVLPAYLVANKNLKEKPAALLQPKPPANGSKIFLERIHLIWDHLSFTRKVTARNIFRYKKRMLMTIFGVCGAVTLLVAGLSVQHSISGVKVRQFEEILQYDMIVAQKNYLTNDQKAELEELLERKEIRQQLPIRYEELTKVAGKKMDKQAVTMIVPEDSAQLAEYIHLTDRKTKQELNLEKEGVVISERLAEFLEAEVGSVITLNDDTNQTYEMKVSAITEMYTGHFLFMDASYYRTVFGTGFVTNANLVTLKDRSNESTNQMASVFMESSSVIGIVQNTTMKNQIDTIVQSLNQIMDILVLVAAMLAIVILYNLTNINVSERIRELSTIKVLGFYDKEVTMYIYRETIILTLIGILVGFLTGDLFYLYILKVVPPEEVMFNPALGLKAFIVPVLVVGTITVALGWVINHKMKHVDMLEALKSVE